MEIVFVDRYRPINGRQPMTEIEGGRIYIQHPANFIAEYLRENYEDRYAISLSVLNPCENQGWWDVDGFHIHFEHPADAMCFKFEFPDVQWERCIKWLTAPLYSDRTSSTTEDSTDG